MSKSSDKKMFLLFISVVFIFAVMVFGISLSSFYKHTVKGTDSGIVVKESENEFQKSLGDNPAYEIGFNSDDMPVFIDKEHALEQLKKDCNNGLAVVKNEFKLHNLSKFYWRTYATYSLQTTNNQEYKDEIDKIGFFITIYENSFM